MFDLVGDHEIKTCHTSSINTQSCHFSLEDVYVFNTFVNNDTIV